MSGFQNLMNQSGVEQIVSPGDFISVNGRAPSDMDRFFIPTFMNMMAHGNPQLKSQLQSSKAAFEANPFNLNGNFGRVEPYQPMPQNIFEQQPKPRSIPDSQGLLQLLQENNRG